MRLELWHLVMIRKEEEPNRFLTILSNYAEGSQSLSEELAIEELQLGQ